MVANKSINLDNIFSLFSPEGEIGKDNDKVFIDLTQNPIYLIGMYKKLVLNYVISSRKIVESLRILNPQLDPQDIAEAGDHIFFSKAYLYIENIELNNPEHIIALEKLSDDDFIFTLKYGIKYFEKEEQYEKCHYLKEILKKVEEFLK
jgi:tRNA U54 and U55 pseudouridine synthase Pus10